MFKSQDSMRTSVFSSRLLWPSCPTNPLQSTLVLLDTPTMLKSAPTPTITTTPTTTTIIKDPRAARDQWTQIKPRAEGSKLGRAQVGLELVVVVVEQVVVGH